MPFVSQINYIIAGKASFRNIRFVPLIKHTLKFDKSIYIKNFRSFTSATRQSQEIHSNGSNRGIIDTENRQVKVDGSEYEVTLALLKPDLCSDTAAIEQVLNQINAEKLKPKILPLSQQNYNDHEILDNTQIRSEKTEEIMRYLREGRVYKINSNETINDNGQLEIIAAKSVYWDIASASRFYEQHFGKFFYDRLVMYMTSGEFVALGKLILSGI
ncbi:Nucleoside diphosphate kinase [Smittium culicis]|uniref:Nucleoside diphosphate kinase n=1 Tax=Smittium culicis TaxID=133412 RepID=A0A1R1YT06_9FUNG|nr:Nucleoside diphosphate kinase [Smittium culicis]OMJ30024.1 Nucleoside diphosphate kinase [Smittium culicis]